MTHRTIAPFGAWQSSISASLVAAGSTPLTFPHIDGDDIYWLEQRAHEGGRVVIVRHGGDGRRTELNPLPFNARNRVHEYGGGAYAVAGGVICFSNFADHQLYWAEPHKAPRAITGSPNYRYADFVFDLSRNRLISVREEHMQPGREAVNRLVAIALDGSGAEFVLAEGCDFYSSPRVSPDGSELAWLSWNHPNMPWDGCDLWLARFDATGGLADIRKLAGSESESIFQPEWSPDGILHFVSDRTGWWNLYRAADGDMVPLCRMDAEFGRPQWQFGMSMYGFASAEEITCALVREGVFQLARLNVRSSVLVPIQTPYTEIQDLHVGPHFAVLVAGAATRPPEVVKLDLHTGSIQVLARSVTDLPGAAMLSVPQTLSFPSSSGCTANGFFYPPVNPDFAGPSGSAPPLIVISHGGPTSMAVATLRLAIQYWTSRGFGVLDVNYRGSTGYGRAYREALNGQWGIVDVDDCENGALYLARQGLADRDRLIIRGGSAGGFTTLCALAFRKTFKAGASHFGVADLESLSADTHKFESRYEIRLVGSRDLYPQRSPLRHAERISCPVIFFQGLDDKVVPPEQSESMVNALRSRGIPVAYITYEGEGHGFRKAENIQRTLEAELYFYSRVFGFELSGKIVPVNIGNL